MAGINNNEDEFELYIRGHSIPEINKITGIALSTLRFRFSKAGILRSRGDGVRCAAKKGKLSSNKGVKRTFTPEWCMNISIAKKLSFKNTCAGVDVSKEYPRITKGAHKGKMIHRLVMEKFIGWLVYVLTGAVIIIMAGAGIGLFLGVAWKIIRLVV